MSYWQQYGFPDPTLMPPKPPVMGILLACEERLSAISENRPSTHILSPITMPQDFSRVYMSEFISMVDDFLYEICQCYVNPDTQDTFSFLTLAQSILEPGETFEGIGYLPASGMIMRSSYSATWLKQRYKMINKLYLLAVPISEIKIRYAFFQDYYFPSYTRLIEYIESALENPTYMNASISMSPYAHRRWPYIAALEKELDSLHTDRFEGEFNVPRFYVDNQAISNPSNVRLKVSVEHRFSNPPINVQPPLSEGTHILQPDNEGTFINCPFFDTSIFFNPPEYNVVYTGGCDFVFDSLFEIKQQAFNFQD